MLVRRRLNLHIDCLKITWTIAGISSGGDDELKRWVCVERCKSF